MDRSQLLQHFETLADTPEAVEKLRALVLDLAIRGSLPRKELKPPWKPDVEMVSLSHERA